MGAARTRAERRPCVRLRLSAPLARRFGPSAQPSHRWVRPLPTVAEAPFHPRLRQSRGDDPKPVLHHFGRRSHRSLHRRDPAPLPTTTPDRDRADVARGEDGHRAPGRAHRGPERAGGGEPGEHGGPHPRGSRRSRSATGLAAALEGRPVTNGDHGPDSRTRPAIRGSGSSDRDGAAAAATPARGSSRRQRATSEAAVQRISRTLPRALPRRRPARPMAWRISRPTLGAELALLATPLVGAGIFWILATIVTARALARTDSTPSGPHYC